MIITLFGELEVDVSDKDWDFLCKYRFFGTEPSYDNIQAEFVSGTGITKQRTNLWYKASELFAEYVSELRDILGVDNQIGDKVMMINTKLYTIPKDLWDKHISIHPKRSEEALLSSINIVYGERDILYKDIEELINNEYKISSGAKL